jgi:hypothetical protein
MRTPSVPGLEHGRTKRVLAWSIGCAASFQQDIRCVSYFIVSLSRKLQSLKESAQLRSYPQIENWAWSLTLQTKIFLLLEPDADLYDTHPKKQDDAQATLPSSKNDERVGTSETPTMGSV